MSVNVFLSKAMLSSRIPANSDPESHADSDGTTFMYEVLPGGALAILETVEGQHRTVKTYAPSTWVTVEGKRRTDDREPPSES